MKNVASLAIGGGLVLGLLYLLSRPSAAAMGPGPQPSNSGPAPPPVVPPFVPPPLPNIPRLNPGMTAAVGDTVVADPASLAGLFPAPLGTTGVLVNVTAASDPYLSGPVIAVVTPLGEQSIDFAGTSITVPRSAVTQVRRNGVVVA